MKKLVIDDKACLCCGSCVSSCEQVFGWAEDGTACVQDESKIEENKEVVEKAVAACPVGAIKWEEE